MSFCWNIDSNERRLEGPFDTLDECKQHCIGCFLPEHDALVVISTVKVVRPEDWSDGLIDEEEILERMDERLCDNIAFEDRVFDICPSFKRDAQAELNAAITAWAIKHVSTSGEWSAGDVVLRTCIKDLRHEAEKHSTRLTAEFEGALVSDGWVREEVGTTVVYSRPLPDAVERELQQDSEYLARRIPRR